MHPPVSYAVPDEFTSPKWAAAFAAGCRGTVATDNVLQPGSVAMFGSPSRWAILQDAIQDGRTYFYGDHAYFRRHQYYRITKNRLQHDGVSTQPVRDADRQRLRDVGCDISPGWRATGTHIVICPNSPVYMSLFGYDAHQWALDCISTLARYTDRPTILRWKSQAARRPLAVDLVDAHAVVVFSSNAAVEAVAAGVPCICLADFAAARRMGRSSLADIENLITPDDRESFLCTLARNQWTFDEMKAGVAWRALRRD